MAEIKSFKGLRFTDKAGETGKVCCPPYDIISPEQKKQYIAENPYNIIRLELPKTAGDTDEAYAKARECLDKWLEDDILRCDDKPGIYIYEMVFDALGANYNVKGYVSLVKLEEFSKGIILPHEETLSKAKEDRFNLMCATGCNFSQIYSLYMDDDNSVFSMIDNESKREPDKQFTDADGVTHRLWCIYDEAFISQLTEKMADKKLYIADGHHRYETALRYKKHIADSTADIGSSEYVTMMLVNMENSGLVVFPTHRIVRDLENFDIDAVIERSRDHFDIETSLSRKDSTEKLDKAYNDGKKAFVLYHGGSYTLMTLKSTEIMHELMPGASKALCELDVSVLHTLVLERIFGIDKENMANQKNLTYTRVLDEAIEAVDNGSADCSFILNPTRVSEIRDVALAGEKMPQKSTYFYPKLTTGLVMNKIFE